jgi:hypothetical protein
MRNAIMQFINIVFRISAEKGFVNRFHPLIKVADALKALEAAEAERRIQWVKLSMIGGPNVIAAAERWNQQAWRLEQFARGVHDGQAEFDQASGERRQAEGSFSAHALRARQADRPMAEFGPRRNASAPRDSASWRGNHCQHLGEIDRHSADSGQAASRALPGGSPLGAAPPSGQHARTRRQAVPAATHPRCTVNRENWPGRPPRTRHSLAGTKITVKGAPKGASPLRGADPGL